MNISKPEQLGSYIRKTRKKLKLTQRDVALASGTGLRFISDLENGKATCRVGIVLKVLANLGIRIQVAPKSGMKGGIGGEGT
jgi:HTH-type transcriptional regulator / antitoxin HipB